MKLEIEITEEEIKSAIERKVRAAVADQTNSYGAESYIKAKIKEYWQAVVDSLVREALKDSETLRKKIRSEIERKLRAQLAKAIKLEGGVTQ